MIKIKYKDMIKEFKYKTDLICYIMFDEDKLSKYWIYSVDEKLKYQNYYISTKSIYNLNLYLWTNKQLVDYFLPDFEIIK